MYKQWQKFLPRLILGLVRWVQRLMELGVDVEITGDHALIGMPDGRAVFRIVYAGRPPRPSEIRRSKDPGLMVAPHLTAGARRRLEALKWSWATADGEFSIDVGGTRLRSADLEDAGAARANQPASTAPRPGRLAYGTAAVIRALLLSREPVTQTQLAKFASITQPRVSQILAELRGLGVVTHVTGGWQRQDHRRLLDHWMRTAPPTGVGTATSWVSAQADPWDTTLQALPLLADARISGDTAADLYAPWRRPRLSIVYTNTTIDLHRIGLVTAERPEEAVLRVINPADHALLTEPAVWRSFRNVDVPLADPLIVWQDVVSGPGTDAHDAADALLAALPRELGWPT
jgi:hypothetical protein